MATFKDIVETKIEDKSGRLMRLLKLTSGEPKELIEHCVHKDLAKCYTTAKDLLDKHYGNEHRISSAFLKERGQWAVLKEGDYSAFKKFFRFLLKCKTCKKSGCYLK